jgi:hypothetical protein
MADESGQESIRVTPKGNGTSVTIHVPRGFGVWHLHFPENMLLDGPGRGKAAMTWQTQEDGTIVLSGKMDGEFAHSIRITYKPGKDIVDLGLEVVNLSGKKWAYGGEAMACLRPLKCDEFMGSEGRRTFVSFDGKPASVADLAPKLKRTIGPKTTVSLMVKGEQMAPYQAERHNAHVIVDDGLIFRQLPDKNRIVAFAWDRVHRVSMNFTYSCMHSNPRVTELAPGEKVMRRGRAYFLQCGLAEFMERYRNDFGAK